MEQLINEVYEIIQDYRQEEGLMTVQRVTDWINQFDEHDRIFVLEEMKHIFKQRYISKERAKSLVKQMFEFLAGKCGYETVKEFLLDSAFIDHQPEGKSQKVLLSFLDEIIQNEFSISIAECNSEKPKYYIYFDDILCTGDTLVKGLTKNDEESKGWFFQTGADGKTNFQKFKDDKAQLILAYFAIHNLSISKLQSKIYFGLGKQNIGFIYAWDTQFAIENDINNKTSKLNFIFPKEGVKDEFVNECQSQIEEKIKNKGYHKEESIKYRENDRPGKEEFFSSAENRDRFEKIILNKCIEIYNTSANLMNNTRPKPLGYGLYSELSFGFGTLIFTWRNVPFNVPLVFWYKSQHWISLFERKFVNYEH